MKNIILTDTDHLGQEVFYLIVAEGYEIQHVSEFVDKDLSNVAGALISPQAAMRCNFLTAHNVPVLYTRPVYDKVSKTVVAVKEFLEHIKNEICHDVVRAALTVVYNETGILGFQRTDGKGLALPCGKIEINESPLEAAVRELEEETCFALNHDQICNMLHFCTMASPSSNAVEVFVVRIAKDFDIKTLQIAAEGFEHEGKPVFIPAEQIAALDLGDDHYSTFNKVLMWNFQQLVHNYGV